MTVRGAYSSAEIQDNAGSSFPTLMQLPVLHVNACKLKLRRELNYRRSRDGGNISQFSVNSDDEVVEFQLKVYNIILDKTLLITLNGKE